MDAGPGEERVESERLRRFCQGSRQKRQRASLAKPPEARWLGTRFAPGLAVVHDDALRGGPWTTDPDPMRSAPAPDTKKGGAPSGTPPLGLGPIDLLHRTAVAARFEGAQELARLRARVARQSDVRGLRGLVEVLDLDVFDTSNVFKCSLHFGRAARASCHAGDFETDFLGGVDVGRLGALAAGGCDGSKSEDEGEKVLHWFLKALGVDGGQTSSGGSRAPGRAQKLRSEALNGTLPPHFSPPGGSKARKWAFRARSRGPVLVSSPASLRR